MVRSTNACAAPYVETHDHALVEAHNFWSVMVELRKAVRSEDVDECARCLDEVEGIALNTDQQGLRDRCVAVLLKWRPRCAAAHRRHGRG